ncbi:DUF3541 domain-containing protein [Vibrio algicola]|uniref:DUF3541 domain-containing protein n=1 Tax=Vibrio algicola TaxID=2662262 RepID=A0A5Q0TIG5_9VIBR|nr:DUF3541 domain-containing protein [Vibrio algicola]
MAVTFKRTTLIIALLGLSQLAFSPVSFAKNSLNAQDQVTQNTYREDAQIIQHTFETQLYTLSATTAGHYGLRLFRQTLDPKYSAAVWSDLARVTSTLSYIADNIETPEQVKAYGVEQLKAYKKIQKPRTQMRYTITSRMPEYMLIGNDLLSTMARANEYGLKHKDDAKLKKLLQEFDFTPMATDHDMIRAWAAQQANQVYWLRQLGEQDVVEAFIQAFKDTYPDAQDKQLSDQQYANKIYGMTHIIFAASEYYQKQLDPKNKEFDWIYAYFSHNIDTIIKRTKHDVIAEVGISFLLAGKLNDPALLKAQQNIAEAIDFKHGMIPSTDGDFEVAKGEHRNVLAIMLLNWQGVNQAPTIINQPHVFKNLPYGLMKK